MSIVENWVKAEHRAGRSIQEALDRLNELTGHKYRHNSVSMWRTGARPIPPPVYRYMLETSLYFVLLRADVLKRATEAGNGEGRTWKEIVRALSPPERRTGPEEEP